MQRLMRKNTDGRGFTLIELLVVISIIALLMSILIPVIARAKEQAQRAFCLHNLHQLVSAWGMYAEENKDRIVNAQIWKVHSCWEIPFGDTPGGGMYIDGCDQAAGLRIYGGQVGWAYWPHLWNTNTPPSKGSKDPPHKLGGTGGITENAATETDWQHGMACGGLWKYIRNFKLYRCPVGEKKSYITYTMSMMMNGHYCNGWCTPDTGGSVDPLCGYYVTPPYRSKMAIKNTSARMVFLDTGNVAGGSWDIRINGGPADYFCWISLPPMRHGKGTTLSFADGHCEYRKWVDDETRETRLTANGIQPPCPQEKGCPRDIIYMQKLVCGRLGQDELSKIASSGCKIE